MYYNSFLADYDILPYNTEIHHRLVCFRSFTVQFFFPRKEMYVFNILKKYIGCRIMLIKKIFVFFCKIDFDLAINWGITNGLGWSGQKFSFYNRLDRPNIISFYIDRVRPRSILIFVQARILAFILD